jgi:hypothetical protein
MYTPEDGAMIAGAPAPTLLMNVYVIPTTGAGRL